MSAMHRIWTALVLVAAVGLGCAGADKRTLSSLRRVEPDVAEMKVDGGLDQAMAGYRSYLAEAPESLLTPEALRRLADLKLEKEYGIVGGADAAALPAPEAGESGPIEASTRKPAPAVPAWAGGGESDVDFANRAGMESEVWVTAEDDVILPDGEVLDGDGPREAIAIYDRILAAYPDYEHNDRVLYQKARAYDELGQPDDAIAVTETLIRRYPYSSNIDEVYFRRAEYFFTRRRYLDAEEAYGAITKRGPVSDFYELALYKLGWTFYKQELHEEAVDQYVALLDHKVTNGYDFDQSHDEDSSRRVADTFRVVSLSFSSIGGPDSITAYFAEKGERPYEDLVYRHLGEFYLDKLRYQDAASAYETFVGLHPMHRSAPYFGMRVVEIYEAGGFPALVLSSKKEFAARYGLGAEYWQQFPIEEADEVVAYLKGNLRDLATHYHAVYQDPEKLEESEANFVEAEQWYRTFLSSFPEDGEAPATHYRLADLLLEHEDFDVAALEYEHTAYGYADYEKASKAGYAAIFSHRKHQDRVRGDAEAHAAVRESAVTSTLRFVDTFPAHEQSAVVLGAAVDDLFQMSRYEAAIENGRRLLAEWPAADPKVLRAAWLAIAHSAFGSEDYPQAEQAYAEVLERTDPEDDSRAGVIDNLAASIYKQGELANEAEDHRAAADHFLRIAAAAPGSAIAPAAEFDAGSALIRLEDWEAAIGVLEAFRENYPEHKLQGEATKQLASVYRTQGELELAAVEYERIAVDATDDSIRREALLVAGELYEEASVPLRAIAVYQGYAERYPEPLELALETRFKVAALYAKMGDDDRQKSQLRWIVDADRRAGAARTDRVRYLAARSSLTLTEGLFDRFADVELVLPFEKSLARKQQRMDEALGGFAALVDYEVGEVTAAATFYMAEIYRDFSASLMASERPTDLAKAELLDYELVLEEEAFPFEEKAIEVHEKNLELMDAGIYNRWVEKSLVELGELMPGRYAKFEESSGLIGSVDRYAYAAPAAPLVPTAAEDPGASSIEPAPEPSPESSESSLESVEVTETETERELETRDAAELAEN